MDSDINYIRINDIDKYEPPKNVSFLIERVGTFGNDFIKYFKLKHKRCMFLANVWKNIITVRNVSNIKLLCSLFSLISWIIDMKTKSTVFDWSRCDFDSLNSNYRFLLIFMSKVIMSQIVLINSSEVFVFAMLKLKVYSLDEEIHIINMYFTVLWVEHKNNSVTIRTFCTVGSV